jgi:signal transduction histidine kinase
MSFPAQFSFSGLFRLVISLMGLLVLVGNSSVAWSQQGSGQDSDIRVIRQVQSIAASTAEPPGEDADWQLLELPSISRLGDSAESNRSLWLRFELERPQDNALHSLYFFRYNLSLDVYFNGSRIGGDSYREGRQTVAWNHPLLVDIQHANWRDNENVVHLRFQGSYFGGTLSEILTGPKSVLQPLYEDRLFRQIHLNQWLQASGLIVTILVLAIWFMRRQDPVYLLFTLMACAWLVLQTHMVVYHNLIEYRYWLPLVHIAIDLFLLFLFLFLTRFAEVPSPRLEKALLVWTSFAIAWHILAPLSIWWMGAYTVHAIGNLFLVYLFVRIGLKALRERHVMSIVIALTVLVQLILGIHDIFLIWRGNQEDWETANYLTQFAFPLLILVFTIALLNRFVAALNLAEELNEDLERKVEASRRMIQASFQEQRELELSRAAEQERVRIYRDLHDDVGSKLLSIVHAGRDHKLGELARTALKSLRDAVSRANSPQQNCEDFFAALREESSLRLQGTGHRIQWELPDSYPDRMLSSELVYNLNQIIREVVSNIIRHAQAETVHFSIVLISGKLTLHIRDDGIGLGNDTGNGNGLRHIRERADSIGAGVAWKISSTGGTDFTLELELPWD